jgi:hypothetical protein
VNLPRKIVAIHERLASAGIDHAFGGALALAWCTERARGTIDIDLNLFVSKEQARQVLEALPKGLVWTETDLTLLDRDGQARLSWDETPVDVFFNTTAFHEQLSSRVRWEPFAGRQLPFLSCRDLAVFKAVFNRTRDWADLEDMADAGTLDRQAVLGVLADHLGGRDPRVEKLRRLRR